MKKILKTMGRLTKKSLPFITGISLLVGASAVFAASPTIGSIATNMQSTVSYLANIITNIALIVGLSLVAASFFKLKQHKDQPTQVPISNGVTLLVIGAALTVFPLLIPTANKAAFGSNVDTGNVSGSQMTSLIGGVN